jgi:hypothetical protein
MKNELKTSPQLNVLQQYEYSGTSVLAGISPLGEMIAIKPICENLGIDRKWQQDKIKSDPYLNSTGGMMKVLAADGKMREMFCLPPEAFQSWLFDITATETVNHMVWNQYKKGLVIHLLMMLKISLDEVKRLRAVEGEYNRLRNTATSMLGVIQKSEDHRRSSRELTTLKRQIFQNLQEQILKDPSQLGLDF